MKRVALIVLTLSAGLAFSVHAQNIRLVHPLGEDQGNTCISTPCRTIGRAIDVAVSGDIIDIAAGEYSERLIIDKSLMLQGAGQDNITIIQAHEDDPLHALGRVITVSKEGLEVVVSDLTIRHGRALDSGGGGLFMIGGMLKLTNVTITDNIADQFGGGINAVRSESELTDVTFRNNHAHVSGGGMGNIGSSTILTDVEFISNTADASGGGLSSQGIVNGPSSSATLTHVDFMTNSARDGGGMHSFGVDTLTFVTFVGNSASFRGGGVDVSGSTILTDVIFDQNNAQRGGGLYSEPNSAPELDTVVFLNNEAQQGGGMYNALSSSPSLAGVTFTNNHATSNPGGRNAVDNGDDSPQGDFTILRGGGMYNALDSVASLTNVTFSGNTAFFAGGGVYSEDSSPELNKVNFINNQALVTGGHSGGMYSLGGEPVLVDVSFRGNVAEGAGGGMTIEDSSPRLTNIQFVGNTGQAGGGIHNLNSSPVIINAIFSGNLAKCFFGTPGNCNGRGGGMFNQNSAPRLINVTFSGNRAEGEGGAAGGAMFNTDETTPIDTPVIRNTIFWNNQDDTGVGTSGASISLGGAAPVPIISFSLLQGAFPSGDGNLDGTDPANDPLFLNMPNPEVAPTQAGNLRLRPESPVIDAGDNSAVDGIEIDLDGNPRIIGGIVDLGAYEFTGEIDDVIFLDRFETP